MGDLEAGKRFENKIDDLTVRIDKTIGGDVETFGNVLPYEYLNDKRNIEKLGMRIEKYTYDRENQIIIGKLFKGEDKAAVGDAGVAEEEEDTTLDNINHDSIRWIGKNKYLYHKGICYMLKDEKPEDNVRFKGEPLESGSGDEIASTPPSPLAAKQSVSRVAKQMRNKEEVNNMRNQIARSIGSSTTTTP